MRESAAPSAACQGVHQSPDAKCRLLAGSAPGNRLRPRPSSGFAPVRRRASAALHCKRRVAQARTARVPSSAAALAGRVPPWCQCLRPPRALLRPSPSCFSAWRQAERSPMHAGCGAFIKLGAHAAPRRADRARAHRWARPAAPARQSRASSARPAGSRSPPRRSSPTRRCAAARPPRRPRRPAARRRAPAARTWAGRRRRRAPARAAPGRSAARTAARAGRARPRSASCSACWASWPCATPRPAPPRPSSAAPGAAGPGAGPQYCGFCSRRHAPSGGTRQCCQG